MLIDIAIVFVESILYVCILSFPLTTLIMIHRVKKTNKNFVIDNIANKYDINIDLKFFYQLRNEYLKIGGRSLISIINAVSLYSMIICAIALVLIISAKKVLYDF